MELRVINIYPETVSDGFGIRFAIYFAGCGHRCEGCHNPQSWNPHNGRVLDGAFAEELALRINSNPLLDGITLSGGDPLFNPPKLLEFLKFLKERTNQNIWCYTGYTYEELLEDGLRRECLKYCDVLIDGPFELKKRNPRLFFRGSENQRIIYLKGGLIDKIRTPESESIYCG